MSGAQDYSNASMLELFRMEVESYSAVLNDGLLAAASGHATPEILEALMRAAHSIKGAARIVGLHAAVEVAHSMEDCFVAAQEGRLTLKAEHVEVLLRGTDFLTSAGQGGPGSKGSSDELVAMLRSVKSTSHAKLQAIKISEPPPTLPPPSSPRSAPAAVNPAIHFPEQDLSGFSLVDLFRVEVESNSTMLTDGIAKLEKDIADREPIEEMRRAAHSIKGAARIVGIDSAIGVAVRMEELLSAVFDEKSTMTPAKLAFLSGGTNILGQLAQDAASPGMEGEGLTRKYAGDIKAWLGSFSETAAETQSPALPPVSPPPPAPAPIPPLKPLRPPSSRSLTFPAVLPAASSSQTLKGVQAPPKPSRSGPRPAVLASTETSIHSDLGTGTNTNINYKYARQPATGEKTKEGARSVRVNATSLSRLMGLAGEALVEARWLNPFEKSLRRLQEQQAQLSWALEKLRDQVRPQAGAGATALLFHDVFQKNVECQELLADRMHAFEGFALRSDNLTHRLYREVIASRMRPFADGIQGFPRMVHDLVRSMGKRARFEVVGKHAEVDRDILEKLEAPLNHLLRNAIDHGLETPDERAAMGKPEQGKIMLEAAHRGGMLVVTVSDDGRGVDLEKVRRKIVDRKLTTQEMALKLTEAEVLEFLFLPGFSTAAKVTEISGRGVGLDVVRNMIQEVSGLIRVSSQLGKGSRFHLQLPITLSVMSSLLVEIANEPYAFPLARIERLVRIEKSQIHTLGNNEYFEADGQHIGLVPAQQVLDLNHTSRAQDDVPVVVIGGHGVRYGLAVDRVLGERDVVVRPLDARLGKIPNISAAALMEDGTPLLIVDVEDMIHSINNLLTRGRLDKVLAGKQADTGSRKRILVVDDSLTVREVERKLLENHGFEVEVATDGAEGWNAVRSARFDLIISDVDMPRMNGIEFVGLIRADPRFKDMPVMIVSYKDREEDRLKGMEAGANFYLAKSSFHDESLLGAVTELIGAPY